MKNNDKQRVINIDNNDHKIKIIKGELLDLAYALRHKVFAEELGWIKSTENRLDIDRYDQGSITIGAFNSIISMVLDSRRALFIRCRRNKIFKTIESKLFNL